MRYSIFVLLSACLVASAVAQTDMHRKTDLDPNRTLVFFPDRDVAPPYKVTGALVDGVVTIFVNGIQVEPSRRRGASAFPTSRLDDCREGFAELQCEMLALGRSRDEVIEAIAERVRGCEGVISVERNEIQLMVVYGDSSRIEYWVTQVNCDPQATVTWKVKRLQGALDRGYAHLFTSEGDVDVRPDQYEGLLAEIYAARSNSRSLDSEWIYLSPAMVRSLQQGMGD